MKARDRSLAVLGGLLLVAGALVVWDRGRPSSDERHQARAELMPRFERAATTELTVERAGVVTSLRHEAGGWFTATPRRRADDGAVEALLAALEYGRIERHLGAVDGAERARLGLAPPRVVVRAAGHVLGLGQDAPGRALYLDRDGEALVVDHRLIETADLDPSLWRSLQLTVTDPAAAATMGYGDWALARRGGWQVTRPVATRADDAKVDALVQALSRSRARRQLDDAAGGPDDAAGGPDGSAGSPLMLDGSVAARIGPACPGFPAEARVVRSDGAVLCFAATDLNLVRAPASVLYDRRLFPVRLDDLVAVDVGPLSLRRADGRWRLTAPAAGSADDAAVRAWLTPIVEARARGFGAAAPIGGVRIRLATANDDFSAQVAGSQARRAGDSVTLELASPLDLTLDALRLTAPADLAR